MKFENLTEKNVLLYAMKCYDNPEEDAGREEFEEDWKHIKYIRRLFNRYTSDGDLKHRLILNHIILLSNVFGAKSTARILFCKTPIHQWQLLKTFLKFLAMMPDVVEGIHGINIDTDSISIDETIMQELEKL
jgi:hypothetical protein